MSYRNPTQVVDTQTGQAYADLQKTIAGSFGNYAKSYEAANARRRKEEKENQKKLLEKRNKILSEENTQLKDFGNIEKTFPTINMDNLYGIIEDNADIKMMELPTPLDQKRSASYNRAGTTFRVSSTNLMSRQQEFIGANNKNPGSQGGVDINAPAELVGNLMNLYKVGSNSQTYETQAGYTMDGNGNLVPHFDVVKKGEKTVRHSGATAFDYIVPNFQPYIDKTIKENIGGFNYKDGNDPIYKGGKKLYDTAGKLIGVYPNKDVYKESIKQSVSANLLGGQTRLEATMLNNNIFNRNPDQSIENGKNWIEFADGDTSDEKKQQDLDKQSIVENGVNFITNQAAVLQAPYIFKQGEELPEDDGLSSGEAFYNELKQNPVGLYQEYAKVAPGFNKKENTITIYAKDTDDGEKIVYNMDNQSERNSFYLDLLEVTERSKGNSKDKQAFRKDFEDAMRLSTKEKISAKNKKKKKEAKGKGPLSNAFYNQSFLPTGKGKFDNLNKKDQ
jgi:hypothetical protein